MKQLLSMQWLTYERKKTLIVVSTILAAISCLVGTIGMIFTHQQVNNVGSHARTAIDPGPFVWPFVAGVAVIIVMLGWFITISKRRAAIEAGTYVPLNG